MNTNTNDVAAEELDAKIIATLVPEQYRLAFLPRHFGALMLEVESEIYQQMRNLAKTYDGGYWCFYDLSNSGSFMCPSEQQLHISAPNGYEGVVSGEVAGIVATLYALSLLSFKHQNSEAIACGFYELRNFAIQHPNARQILAAID